MKMKFGEWFIFIDIWYINDMSHMSVIYGGYIVIYRFCHLICLSVWYVRSLYWGVSSYQSSWSIFLIYPSSDLSVCITNTVSWSICSASSSHFAWSIEICGSVPFYFCISLLLQAFSSSETIESSVICTGCANKKQSLRENAVFQSW